MHRIDHQSPFMVIAAFVLAGLLQGGCAREPASSEARTRPVELPEGSQQTEGAHAVEGHSQHEGEEHEVSDLDLPLGQLLAARCEHDVSTYTCDECRYEVGVVKVSADLIDGDGPLDTARVTARAPEESQAHNGEVHLNEARAAYLSPRASGTVEAILVDLGHRVRRGQILFTVNSPEFAQARAAFLSADAALRLTTASLERERGLHERGIRPRKDLEEAEAAYEEAFATRQAAQEHLLACGLNPSELDGLVANPGAHAGALPVKAPFDGTVLERSLGLGAMVEPGDRCLLLGDTSEMWIETSLYEREMASLLQQQGRGEVLALVDVPAYPGRTFAGRVDRMGGVLDEQTRTVKLRVVVANPDGALRAGMFARVHLLDGGARPVPAVPAEAVLEDEGRSFVFVPIEQPYFVRRPVVTGRSWDGWIEVAQGLDAGDVVVGRGAFVLKSDVLRSKMGAGCAD